MNNRQLYIDKRIIGILLTGFILWCCNACTKKFDQYNVDPGTASDEQLLMDNNYVGIFIKNMQQNVISINTVGTSSINSYQVAQNLCGDVYSGYMGASNNWNGGSNNTTYGLITGWYGEAFKLGFTQVLPSWNSIKLKVKSKAPDQYALAQIIKVEAMHRVTDIYGPLPYFGAGTSGLTTRYNPQDSIYYSFINDLDSAVTTLSSFVTLNPGAKPLAVYDLVYAGDYIKWIKFANSLKLRLAMRMVYANPTLAKKYAEEAVNNKFGLIVNNDTENAIIRKITGHPLNVISDINGYHDIRMGANMESFLNGYSDPRLKIYFQTASAPLNTEYHGVRNGISIPDASKYIAFSPLSVLQNVQWMAAAETYFLRAEGALRGWNMGGNAQSLYEMGVQKSFDQFSLGSATAYLGGTSLPAAYKDPANSSNNISLGSSLLSTITVKWGVSDSFERNLERIITQKWIAMYPDGQEAWTEFRRTRYPKVFPVVLNFSNGTINTAIQIRRMPFPLVEYQTNSAGLQSGIAALNGPDNGGTKLWWDKKP